MRILAAAATFAVVLATAASAREGAAAHSSEPFHGVTVLMEHHAKTQADSRWAHASLPVGPFPADAVVFLSVEGGATYLSQTEPATLTVSLQTDERVLFANSTEPRSGEAGESAEIGTSTKLFLPRGEQVRVTLSTVSSEYIVRTRADLRALAIAAPGR
jgi:subtilisin family serine protease